MIKRLKILLTISLFFNGLIAFCQPPPAWQLEDIKAAWAPRFMPPVANLDSTWEALWRRGNVAITDSIGGTVPHYAIFTGPHSIGDGWLEQHGNYVTIPNSRYISGEDSVAVLALTSGASPSAALGCTAAVSGDFSQVVVDTGRVYIYSDADILLQASLIDIDAGSGGEVRIADGGSKTNIVGVTQVGSTGATSASALMTFTSTTKGVRFPVLTTAQKNAIASPVAGLVVYDSSLGKLCIYTTQWETITSAP